MDTYSSRTNIRFYILILAGILTVLLVLVGVGAYVAMQSLPGSKLYSVRTAYVEPFFSKLRFTDSMRASYGVSLLENRLNEMVTLSEDTATTTEVVAYNMTLSAATESQRVISEVESSTSLSPEEKITLLSRAFTITNSMETLAGTVPEFQSVEDALTDVRRDVSTSLRTSIGTFASSSSPENVVAYTNSLLTEVSNEMKFVTHGSTAERQSNARLSDARDAIVDGDMGDAMWSLIRAKEAITRDKFLFASEHGSDSIPEPVLGEAPAGS
jgi:hypothetical protein